MAIVDFNSSIWSDPWFRKLSVNGKTLFIYLWSNSHKSISGIYSIDLETMSFETGIPIKQCQQTLSKLTPKVKYDYQESVVWVVNHVRHQFMRTQKISDQIKTGIERNLILLKPHHFVMEFLEFYKNLDLDIGSIEGLQGVLLDPPGEGGGVGEGKGKDFNSDIKEKEKIQFRENILLTEEENQKLIDRFGEDFKDACFDKLQHYKASKGKTYKSDYSAILNWVVDEVKKNRGHPLQGKFSPKTIATMENLKNFIGDEQ